MTRPLKTSANNLERRLPDDKREERSSRRSQTTYVHTDYREQRCNLRVLVGQPDTVETLEAQEGFSRCRYAFSPGARFVLDLWRRNAYGTVQWRCFVCEAIEAGEAGEWVHRVTPGVRVLLSTRGAVQSRLFLAWFAALETDAIDPLRCAPEVFEAAHFRLAGSRADCIPPRRLSGQL